MAGGVYHLTGRAWRTRKEFQKGCGTRNRILVTPVEDARQKGGRKRYVPPNQVIIAW